MNDNDDDDLYYDIVIVGGGTAGCLAARILSEQTQKRVLVLEAGGQHIMDSRVRDSDIALQLPALYFPEFWYPGKSVPQQYANDRYFNWTGGRMLGGCSSVNGEQFIVPSTHVMKQWHALLNSKQDVSSALWTPETKQETLRAILLYYSAHQVDETQETTIPDMVRLGIPLNEAFDRAFKIDSRGLKVTQQPTHPTPLAQKLCDALTTITGLMEIKDYNHPETPIGPFTRWDLTQSPWGIRDSSDTAFLLPDNYLNSRENLDIMLHATVTRILWQDNKAVGVVFLHNGREKHAFANDRVILTAGLKTPKILMLSGVGERKHLESLDIPMIVDNPQVGRNLLNHLLIPFKFNVDPNLHGLPKDEKYAIFEGGAFLPGPEANTLFSTTTQQQQRAYQIMYMQSGEGEVSGYMMQLRPKSAGTIRLQSKDPLQLELVDYNYLSEQSEVDELIYFFDTYFSPLVTSLEHQGNQHYDFVEPSRDVLGDHDKLEQYIRGSSIQADHYTSTCSAGQVVDGMGYVYGTEHLMIMDDSVMPITNDGNTQAPAYIIAYLSCVALIHILDSQQQ